MINLQALMEASKEDLPDIYCDMDMVLVNFMKGADEAVGGDFVTSDKETRWKAVSQVKGFWPNLDDSEEIQIDENAEISGKFKRRRRKF